MSDETQTVRFEVVGVEPVRGKGALVALAIVHLEVAGVEFTLQGVSCVSTPAGIEVRSPVFRHPATGRWLPGILLPDGLREALAAEVVGAWQRPA